MSSIPSIIPSVTSNRESMKRNDRAAYFQSKEFSWSGENDEI